jgi:GNAT superfamily N-acetyltransferase
MVVISHVTIQLACLRAPISMALEVAEQDLTQCLVPVDFDAQAFGFPFYRVIRFDQERLTRELDSLRDLRPVAADAKTAADDVTRTHTLLRLGFRKICMQIALERDPQGAAQGDPEVCITGRLDLDDDVLWRHARNFNRDRFSLDPLLPAEGRHRLYYQWLRNSLGGAKRVASLGPNLCTFSHKGDGVVIDLVSILQPRRGIGARIVSTVTAAAAAAGARSVRVVTECENTAAWSLYQKSGFKPVQYTSAFHLVRL